MQKPKMLGSREYHSPAPKHMISSRPPGSDSSGEGSKRKKVDETFTAVVSLTGDDEMNKRFQACVKNDFPLCLDDALQIIFGSSEKESLNLILQRARRGDQGNYEKITSPQGIWELYKRVIQEFQKELGDSRCKVIETESTNKMKLIHCHKCPLYEFELQRLQDWYK